MLAIVLVHVRLEPLGGAAQRRSRDRDDSAVMSPALRVDGVEDVAEFRPLTVCQWHGFRPLRWRRSQRVSGQPPEGQPPPDDGAENLDEEPSVLAGALVEPKRL